LLLFAGNNGGDALSPLGSPIVLQRKGSVYGSNVPMITELVNDSNVQFLDQVQVLFFKLYNVKGLGHEI
jgi:potassium large conductance calcium-activated channel subfamily M alpha protein 1